jgi:hypothetical protein
MTGEPVAFQVRRTLYMKDQQTTKQGKTAGGNKVTTSSPLGQEELQAQTASEQQGETKPPKRRDEKKKDPPVHNVDMPQNRNPKHTGRSPRT